jgi:hypothetical protein
VYRYQVTALKRFAFGATLVSVVILIVVYGSLFFIIHSAHVQQWLKAEAIQRTGYEISWKDLRLKFPLRFIVADLKVSDESGTLLEGERVAVTFSFIDLFSKSIYRLEIQKPIFHVDLEKLLDASDKSSLDIAVRQLNIENGTLVLKTAIGQSLDFRAINLSARNLNLAQATGVVLRADIPWLKGSVEIAVRGKKDEQEAEIKFRQASNGKLTSLPLQTPRNDALTVKIKMRRTPSQAFDVLASGLMAGLTIGTTEITGQFDSRASLTPSFETAVFSLKFMTTELPAQIGSVKLTAIGGGAGGTLEGSYSFPEKTLTLKAIHLDSSAGTADGKGVISFSPEPVVANAKVTLRKIPAEAIRLFLPETINAWTIHGSAEVDLEAEGPWRTIAIKGVARTHEAELKSGAFSLQQLNLIAPFEWVNASLRAGNVQMQGKTLAVTRAAVQFAAEEVELDGAVAFKPNEPLKVTGKLRLVRGRYATSDDSKMGENLNLTGHFDMTRRTSLTSLSGDLAIEQGELLWGKFFGDLKSQKPSLLFDGDYLSSDDELQLRRINLSLASVGKIELSGALQQVSQKPIARIRAKGDDIQPSGVFEFFIRETLRRSYPILDQLTVGGGIDLAAQVDGAWDDLSVEGNLRVRQGILRTTTEKWQVGPIDLALPFRVHLPAANSERVGTNIPNGTLAINALRFGSESVPRFRTTVSLWNNALRFHQPLRFPIYGGTIEIRNLAWNDLIEDPQTFSLSAQAKDLQLQRLTEALGWYRFGGSLSGSIPKIEMIGNVLRSEGEIQIELFGGHIQVSKMEIENPFSSLPAIKLDARFQSIHLEQASETFEFGRISGILEGQINNLTIIDGQPAQMEADLYTVEGPDSQWISIEALNKITVLSSGNDGSLAYKGIAGFLDSFRYSKMGFKASLKNDKLTLRGIESRDGKEFLVVGSFLPPTVNVISHTQEIGFSDLLKRLKQIQKSDQPQIK